MDTNTMMLIVLAILVILSALGIWLANRGTGVTSAKEAVEEQETYEPETTSSTKVADQ